MLASIFSPSYDRYEAPPITYPQVEASVVSYPEETLQEQARTIASEMDFPFSILEAVINSETGGTWDCSKVGKAGELGCFQIIPEMHPDVDPMDFEASVKYFISEYRAGRDWQWTSCSCVQLAKAVGVKIKGNAADITPNTDYPEVGGLIIFEYKNNPYPYNRHIAVIRKVAPDGIYVVEGNFDRCAITRRLISWSDPSIRGYWSPI